jgi:hypothetical protein
MNKARQNCATTKNPNEKPYQPMGILKILRKKSRNQKYQDFCQIFVIFHTQKSYLRVPGMDSKIYRKSIA